MLPSYLEVQKTCSQLYRDQTYHAAVNTTNGVESHISSLTNTVAAIWREKNVDPCYLENKKYRSQLLGARKMIMTSI